jgi:rRNA maturation RNase YbeY
MPLYTSKSKVYFFFQGVSVYLENRIQLKNFIHSILKKEEKKLECLNFVFCTDKALLEINRQFLYHDFYTDIITFDLSEKKGINAEIYISVDRVKENALNLGVSFKSELHRVVFHGVLHLCGYKDKNKVERTKMRQKEDECLRRYFK